MSETSTEIEISKPSDGVLSERMKYAQALASADLLPAAYRRKPANVLLAMEFGHALGLDTVTAIQQVHVIEGKPSASAQLIGGLVRRAGHRLRVTGDDKHAVAEVVRRDDPDFVFRAEWTIQRAQAAGLTGKGPWKQYPAAMLKARAITEVARDACPEALAGVAYTPEELGDDNTASWTITEEPPAIEAAAPVVVTPLEDMDTGEIYAYEETPEPEPEGATANQTRAIAVLLGKCGIDNREERHSVIEQIIGHTFTTLSKKDASMVIDLIKPIADGPNPVQAFADWNA